MTSAAFPVVDEARPGVQEERPMNILVWQWGRRGAGPLLAVRLAEALRSLPRIKTWLSLSIAAEILQGQQAPDCALPVSTYAGRAGLVWRLLRSPLMIFDLVRRLRVLDLDVAVCAMPGPLDLLCVAALRWLQVPAVVIVHDADTHPGERYPFRIALQRRLLRSADAIVALSHYVAARLLTQGAAGPHRPCVLRLPPLFFESPLGAPRAHGGPFRMLFFGRLLPYKGLNLLRAAVSELGHPGSWVLRVIGSGPESSELEALRATAGVVVENRWVADDEIGALIAWSDAVVLPYVEASQSGVAPAALAAGRIVVATRVGGLAEQLGDYKLARLCDPQPESLCLVLRQLLDERPEHSASGLADSGEAWRGFAAELVQDVLWPVIGRDPQTSCLDHRLPAV
jgi:glycosyltransferase involved in cell wall biosynthesis